MASPPLLDFEMLLAPIPGPNPAGEPLSFALKTKLNEARKEVNPNQYDPRDPRRPDQPLRADWPAIEQLTKDALARTSKDLALAARLTEALVKQYGFAGLRDGLQLLRRLLQECWDRIHPAIQDDDLEPRAAVFVWLNDNDKGARFPTTLRYAPLTRAGKEPDELRFGWRHWTDAQEKKGPVTAEVFDQAVTATPRDYCQTIVEDIAESTVELAELATTLTTTLGPKMGHDVPSLEKVQGALYECQQLALHMLKRKGPAPMPTKAVATPAAESVAVAETAAMPMGRHTLTREDVLARLADASALLLQMEPQSPIAYMVQRAVRLARLPLPELMRVLVRDNNVLGQLDRDLDLGLEKQEAAKPGKK